MLKELLNEILLSESVSPEEVLSALDNHNRVVINYHTNGEDIASGARVIEVYAYGLTKAGNPVIRAFQPFGDTTTKVPSWKFFRLDRISKWEPTGQKFSNPASVRFPGLGEFNETGDKTMSVVYNIAKFDDEEQTGYERLMQQLNNPITLDTLTKSSQKQPTQTPVEEPKPDVYRTSTETGMSNLLGQLNNPNIRKIDLSKFDKPKTKQGVEKDRQKDKERVNKIKDLIGQKEKFTKSELDKATEPEEQPTQTPVEEPKPDVYRTSTETGMSNLLNQLQSPRKIDLSKIPRR